MFLLTRSSSGLGFGALVFWSDLRRDRNGPEDGVSRRLGLSVNVSGWNSVSSMGPDPMLFAGTFCTRSAILRSGQGWASDLEDSGHGRSAAGMSGLRRPQRSAQNRLVLMAGFLDILGRMILWLELWSALFHGSSWSEPRNSRGRRLGLPFGPLRGL